MPLTEAVILGALSVLSALGGAFINSLSSRHSVEKSSDLEANRIAVAAIDTTQRTMLELIKAQEEKIARMDARIDKAYSARDAVQDRLDDEEAYTEVLVNHINRGLPPPPPPRAEHQPRKKNDE